MKTKSNPPSPDSQTPGGVPWPQSCTCSAGITADKTYRWEQNTRFLGLFSLLEAQRVEKNTPTSRARLSLEPQYSEPGSHQPLDQWGTPADSGYSWSRRCKTLAPRPSDSLLSDAAWAGRGPPGGLRGRCASGTRPGVYYQHGPGAPTRSSTEKSPARVARYEGHGQGGRGRTGSLRASASSA